MNELKLPTLKDIQDLTLLGIVILTLRCVIHASKVSPR